MFIPNEGQTVGCPEDRGDAAYRGVASDVGREIHHNHKGDPFVWLTVRHPRGHASIWPSNRLSA